MGLNTSELYKRILQDRINLNPNIKDSYLNQGRVALTWQQVIGELDEHIDKLKTVTLPLNSLSRPVFNEKGSMVDATGKRIGNIGVQLGSVTTPDDQPVRVTPELTRKIGSYFGGKISRTTKIKRSKNARKTKNNRKTIK